MQWSAAPPLLQGDLVFLMLEEKPFLVDQRVAATSETSDRRLTLLGARALGDVIQV